MKSAEFIVEIRIAGGSSGYQSGHPVEAVLDFTGKIAVETGLACTSLKRGSARLAGEGGAMIPLEIDGVSVSGQEQENVLTRFRFCLPAAVAPGELWRSNLHFEVEPIPSEGMESVRISHCVADGDFARETTGIAWDFDEGAAPVFAEARHATIREGFGGFLWAKATGEASLSTLGTVLLGEENQRYSRLVLRARKSGPSQVSLLANDGIPLKDAAGNSGVSEDFAVYAAELHPAQPALTLQWGSAGENLTAEDQLFIDWIRLYREEPVAVFGAIRRKDEAPGSLKVHAAWYKAASEIAYLYVQNTGPAPLELDRLALDGKWESAELWPLDPMRRAHWFDFQPRVLEPGGIAQVRASLRQCVQAHAFLLTVLAKNGERVSHCFEPREPRLAFCDLATSALRDRVAFFVRGAGTRVAAVRFDGRDVTSRCDLAGGLFFGGYACGSIAIAEPLAPGSHHLIEVENDRGDLAIYWMRVLPADLILGTYGIAAKASFEDYKAHGLNHYLSFRYLDKAHIDDLAATGMTGGSVASVGGSFEEGAITPFDRKAVEQNVRAIAGHPGLLYYSAPDEPDCSDYKAGGIGSHGRAMIELAHLYQRLDPSRPTFMQMDNTFRTKNYHVYGQVMDYASTHVYQLGQHFLGAEKSALEELRQSTEPNPMIWVTQFYPLRSKQGERVAYNGRLPVAEEMHLQMLHAVAHGVKGILHYMHSGSLGGGGGAGRDQSLWDAMTPQHRQLAAVGELIVRSTPVPWATSDNMEATVSALLVDPRNLLLVVVNHDFRSRPDGFSLEPIRDLSIRLGLPAWLDVAEAQSVLPGGELEPVGMEKVGNSLAIAVGNVGTGLLLWLRNPSREQHDFPQTIVKTD